MELVEIMQSFLPREVVELFGIVKIADHPSDWRMTIYLGECYGVDGKQLEHNYKHHISDYHSYDQRTK